MVVLSANASCCCCCCCPLRKHQLRLELTNTEDIIGIREETNTGDDASTNMVPSEWGLVDLGEGKSSSLIRVGDMSEVVVEVVERSVTSRCGSYGHLMRDWLRHWKSR